MTYELDGEQYAAVAGWDGEVAERVKVLNQGGSVWVFKLAN